MTQKDINDVSRLLRNERTFRFQLQSQIHLSFVWDLPEILKQWLISSHYVVLNWVFKYNTIFCASLLALVNLAYVWKASAWFVSNYIPLEILCQAIVTVDLSGVAYFVYYMNVPLFKKVRPHSSLVLRALLVGCTL